MDAKNCAGLLLFCWQSSAKQRRDGEGLRGNDDCYIDDIPEACTLLDV